MEKVITQNYLKSILEYDKSSGVFSWKVSRKGVKNKVAGCLHKSSGYTIIGIDNKHYYAHRLAILYITGDIPDDMFIDHINGNKSDNRLNNLRLTDKSGNELNKSITSRNTTGYKNISYYNSDKSYVAELLVKGKKVRKYIKSEIGDQETLKHLNTWISVMREELRNGFHNHGEYNSL